MCIGSPEKNTRISQLNTFSDFSLYDPISDNINLSNWSYETKNTIYPDLVRE